MYRFHAVYPQRWIGKVEVMMTDGRTLAARVDEPKGDPGNPLSRDEIEAKVAGLNTFRSTVPTAVFVAAVPGLWATRHHNSMGRLLHR